MFNRDPLFVPPAILPVTLRRGADRRRGIAALTAAVTTGLALADPRAARDRLEEELRGALQARSVRLRDDGAQAGGPPPEAVCFDIASSQGDGRARLEVIFDKPRPLDDWTCELIEAATQLASVVLELERAIGRVRLGASPNHPSRRRGAPDRFERGDPARPRANRTGSGDRFHRPHRRRERSTAAPQFHWGFELSFRRATLGRGGGGGLRVVCRRCPRDSSAG